MPLALAALLMGASALRGVAEFRVCCPSHPMRNPIKATAMVYRKGELNDRAIDRDCRTSWPSLRSPFEEKMPHH